MSVEAAGLWTLTVVVTISHVIIVTEALGLLPDRISRWINRNRARQTVETLEQLGFNVDLERRRIAAARLPPIPRGASIADRVRPKLAAATLKGPIRVGDVERVTSLAYIDVMGHSADPAWATDLARDLVAHWKSVLPTDAATPSPKAVAAPKLGSPLLAAAVAEIMELPLILVNPNEKFAADRANPKAWLDSRKLPARGSNVLLVDDSTTGGAKALSAVARLRQAGYSVTDFLVLFEPQLKDARGKLGSAGVRLHSILKT